MGLNLCVSAHIDRRFSMEINGNNENAKYCIQNHECLIKMTENLKNKHKNMFSSDLKHDLNTNYLNQLI